MEGKLPTVKRDKAILRVATLNLWGRFSDWPRRLEVIAWAWPQIDADVLCVQEACRDEYGDQAAELAQRLGLADYAIAMPSDRPEGPGVVSRYPLGDIRPVLLAESSPERCLLAARLRVGGADLDVISAHTAFDPPATVRWQLREVFGYSQAEQLVIGADLNATPGKVFPLLGRYGLSEALGRKTPPSWPLDVDHFRRAWMQRVGHAPRYRILRRRLDYLMSRGLGCIDAGMVAIRHDGIWASDHTLLWADYRIG